MLKWQTRAENKARTEYTDWVIIKRCKLALWPPRSLVPNGPRPDMWYFCLMVPVNYDEMDKILRPTPAMIARGSKQYANMVDGFAPDRDQARVHVVERTIEAFESDERFTNQFRSFSPKVRRGVVRELKSWLKSQSRKDTET